MLHACAEINHQPAMSGVRKTQIVRVNDLAGKDTGIDRGIVPLAGCFAAGELTAVLYLLYRIHHIYSAGWVALIICSFLE